MEDHGRNHASCAPSTELTAINQLAISHLSERARCEWSAPHTNIIWYSAADRTHFMRLLRGVTSIIYILVSAQSGVGLWCCFVFLLCRRKISPFTSICCLCASYYISGLQRSRLVRVNAHFVGQWPRGLTRWKGPLTATFLHFIRNCNKCECALRWWDGLMPMELDDANRYEEEKSFRCSR